MKGTIINHDADRTGREVEFSQPAGNYIVENAPYVSELIAAIYLLRNADEPLGDPYGDYYSILDI